MTITHADAGLDAKNVTMSTHAVFFHTQSPTVVEDAFLQQHLPHAHSLNTGVHARTLLHLPVNQFCPHAALPGKDKVSLRSRAQLSGYVMLLSYGFGLTLMFCVLLND